MKKIFLSMILLTLMLSVAACSKTTPPETKSPSLENKQEDMGKADDMEKPEKAKSEMGDSLGASILQDFHEALEKGQDKDALTIAQGLLKNEKIQFDGSAYEVEAGLLEGFDQYEVKGFTKAALFAPEISSIAFIGYVFELPETADVDDFVKGLKENANPSWNICVTAEETIVEAKGNMVFFLMCPHSFDRN